MTSLRIEILGRCSAVVRDHRVEPSAEIVFAAVLLLGLERDRVWQRSEIAACLWPDATDATRASRLRWLLAKLRSIGLPLENNSIGVSLRHCTVVVDVDELESLAAEAIGEVLPGYAPQFSKPFARWVDEQRDRQTSRVVRHLLPQLQSAIRRSDWKSAIALAEAIQRVDALNEEATLALAEVQCRIGAKAKAVTVIDRYLEAVGEATPELRVRARQLLDRIQGADDDRQSAAESRFVGRRDELARTDALLANARRGRGAALILVGPAGIGKTRLLDEASQRARLARMQVVRVRCQRSDSVRPLSGVIDLIPQLLPLRGAAGCSPDNMNRLRKLASIESSEIGPASEASPQLLRAQIVAALLDLLEAVSAEQPLLVQVDDVQWANASLRWFWDALLSSTTAHPIAWLFAQRTSRRDAPALSAPSLAIGSLDAEASDELLRSLETRLDRPLTTDARAALMARGAGSPLFLQELARHWAATGSAEELPASLAGVFDAGLAGLSRFAQRTLQVAAILGNYATLDRIEHLVELSRSNFIGAVNELEASGILTSAADGATYGHVLWAEASVSQLSPNVRRVIHRHAAERLNEELEAEPRVALLWEVARHWEAAGRPERAKGAIVAGAEHLARSGFTADAAVAFGRAIRLADDSSEELPLLRRQIDLLSEAGHPHETIAAIDRHERLSAELYPGYDRHNSLELLRVRNAYLSSMDASAVGASMLRCARDHAATVRHRLRAAAECAKFAEQFSPGLLRQLRDIAMSVDPRTDEEARDRNAVDRLYELRLGSILRSRAIAEEEMSSERRRGVSRGLAAALQGCGRAYLLLGEVSEARAAFVESIALCKQLGLVQVLAIAHDQLIGMSLDFDHSPMTQRLIDEAREDLAILSLTGEVALSSMSLPSHQAQLAIAEGRPDEALRLAVPLSVALQFSVPRFRARLSAIHLAARMLKGLTDGCDEIADTIKACFGEPDDWLDWPALVLANFLVRRDAEEARQFAENYISLIRRELYPAPEQLRAIAAGDVRRVELLTTA